jgi:hypothetical protein
VVEAQATVTRKFLAMTMMTSVRFKLSLKKTLMICIWIVLKCRATRMMLLFCGNKLLFRAPLCAICEAVSAKNPRYPLATKARRLPGTFLKSARLLSAF